MHDRWTTPVGAPLAFHFVQPIRLDRQTAVDHPQDEELVRRRFSCLRPWHANTQRHGPYRPIPAYWRVQPSHPGGRCSRPQDRLGWRPQFRYG